MLQPKINQIQLAESWGAAEKETYTLRIGVIIFTL